MTKVEIIAHRGASYDAPENTLAAIRLAWEQGADGVEIDVHLSQDGEIIVLHDANTLRTTGHDADVAALTLEEIQRLDAGAWKGEAFTGERIPTLNEVLELLQPQKSISIEIKSRNRAIIRLLRIALEKSGVLPEQIFLIGFDYDLMKEIKAALPHLSVLWLRGSESAAPEDEMIALCCDAHFDGLNLAYDWPMDEAFAAHVQEAGLRLFVWTVDDTAVARRLVSAGVDGITTNRPAWLHDQLL